MIDGIFEVVEWVRERNSTSGNPSFSFVLRDSQNQYAGRTKPNSSFVYGLSLPHDSIGAVLKQLPSGRWQMVDGWNVKRGMRSNPLTRTTVAADSQRPRASKTAKGRPTTTKAPSRRLMARRRVTAEAPEGFYGNPLSRVKINSPSMATGEPPSKRLKKRRTKTARQAMPGVYANPAPSFAFDAVHADRGTYAAQMKKSGRWQTVAVFRDFKEAKSWGQTVSDSHNKQVRIVGNLKVK